MREKKDRRLIWQRAGLGLLKTAGVLLGACLLAFGGLIAYLSFGEFRPKPMEKLETKASAEPVDRSRSIRILSWNVGYGSVGDNADFFMDGGRSVQPSTRERVEENMEGIETTGKALKADIAMFQEVDLASKRSYYIDQTEILSSMGLGEEGLPARESLFAANFQVPYVPYPLPPIGRVKSGIQTVARFGASDAERIQLPIPFKWPVSLGNLKRCLLVTRFPIRDSDRELVLINLHLEAYDDGSGKAAQTRQLLSLMEEEYGKGNYVIAAGDFNQVFSTADISAYYQKEGVWQPGKMEVSSMEENWQFLMDERTPSCRSLDIPLAGADPSTFQFYLIDGFIVSANLAVDHYETVDTGFRYSDHNPILAEVRLLEEE